MLTRRELGKLKAEWNETLAGEFAGKKAKRRRRAKAATEPECRKKPPSKRARRRAAKLKAMSYRQYIHSREWRTLANKRRRKAKGRCETCGKSGRQVHHIEYPKGQDWSLDHVENLRLLCGTCHLEVHGLVVDGATQGEVDAMDEHFAEIAEQQGKRAASSYTLDIISTGSGTA